MDRIEGATDPLLLEGIFRYYLPSDFSSLKYKTSAINPLEAKIALPSNLVNMRSIDVPLLTSPNRLND